MLDKQSKDSVLYTYVAVDIETDKVISKGNNIEDVDKVAQSSGKEYMIKFMLNSNYSFVF